MKSARNIRYNRTGPRSIDRYPGPRPGGAASVAPRAGGFGILSGDGGLVSNIFGDATQNVGGTISSLFGGQGGLEWPLNFIHNLQPNMPLSQAIQETLSKVFPNAKLDINISSLLKLGYQDAGMYQNFSQYASFIKNLSHSILGTNNYAGVNMTSNGNTIRVWDGTSSGSVTEISAYDLIGQPTWVETSLIHISCVLRGDLSSPDLVSLPSGIVIGVGIGSNYSTQDQKNRLSFSGVFRIQRVQHVGDFRNPDGVQWSTNYECTALTANEAATAQTSANAAQADNVQTGANTEPLSANLGGNPPGSPTLQTRSRLLTRPVRRM
jgi:hypothetical protein